MANRRRTDYIVIHCTASGSGGESVADIRSWHKRRGWSDIGYNVVVTHDGKVNIGRGWDRIGAHVAGYNSRSVGIAWTGGRDGDTRTAAQRDGLKRAVKAALKRYPNAKVVGHRDLSPDSDGDGIVEPHEWTKTCPRFNAEVWAAENGFPHTNFSGGVSGKAKEARPATRPDNRIVWLQKLLREEGAAIHADGILGPRTAGAIEAFQQDHGLKITGEFDSGTVILLRNRAEDRRKPAEPVRRPKVTAVAHDAAADGRTSTTKIAAGVAGFSAVVGTGNDIAESVQQASSIADTIMSAGPWVLLALVGVGAAWWIWKERRRKANEARKALAS